MGSLVASEKTGERGFLYYFSGTVRGRFRGGKRRGLGPRNDVLTTCKAVTARGGQRKIAVLFSQ